LQCSPTPTHTVHNAILSGQAANLSGQAANLSGQAANLSGQAANLSGQAANLSGQAAILSDQAANLSGQAANLSLTEITARHAAPRPSQVEMTHNYFHNTVKKLPVTGSGQTHKYMYR
jgi:hypothetical protein